MYVECSFISDFYKHGCGGVTLKSVVEFRTAHVRDKLLISLVKYSVIHA